MRNGVTYLIQKWNIPRELKKGTAFCNPCGEPQKNETVFLNLHSSASSSKLFFKLVFASAASMGVSNTSVLSIFMGYCAECPLAAVVTGRKEHVINWNFTVGNYGRGE